MLKQATQLLTVRKNPALEKGFFVPLTRKANSPQTAHGILLETAFTVSFALLSASFKITTKQFCTQCCTNNRASDGTPYSWTMYTKATHIPQPWPLWTPVYGCCS
ncbi:hypothetical protein JTE90_020991 [Oedothorax gibbosus]|uniref:Uncharacterized protein n=1 Tax=Oedothorax gibbosus TaxID=931172 RepID=A0AAV6TY61_9ARAC|nr:hypothetical protein JTE90_020991 [Oedothorax gibbosus]